MNPPTVVIVSLMLATARNAPRPSEAGKLTRDDIRELERIIKQREEREPETRRRSK
ncbi:MAG: hypothetical protein LAP85_15130 [Acidobacteriia bacterium]|nr:hypothetical protein [Terriglobia bacterium]